MITDNLGYQAPSEIKDLDIINLGLGGLKGVTSVFNYFEKDLKRVMQLTSTQTIEDIKNTELF